MIRSKASRRDLFAGVMNFRIVNTRARRYSIHRWSMNPQFRDQCLSGLGPPTPGRCLVIAEVAQAHDGSLGMAHAFVDAAANAGADAVKFQTHIAAEESTPREPWRVKFSRQDASRYDYWKRMEFTEEQWLGLKRHADDRGILFMSSPFSGAAVDLLAGIGMKVWKIASGEIGNLQLLQQVVGKSGPIILSSGMSDWRELDTAVDLARTGDNPLAVLQCTTAYPCPADKVGLNLIREISDRYGLPTGLSDHSGDIFAGLAAVTLGAEVLEVHVTLSREMFGPDVPASVTTLDLHRMVEGIRKIETMVETKLSKETLSPELEELRKVFSKSIVAKERLPVGTIIKHRHLALRKPGNGLAPDLMPSVIGCSVRREIDKNDPLSWSDLDRN